MELEWEEQNMRLIDADALLDKLPKEYLGSTVHLLINNAPTVVTDRPYGKWFDRPKGYYCSVCGKWCDRGTHNFCPNCGAKMDGDEHKSL